MTADQMKERYLTGKAPSVEIGVANGRSVPRWIEWGARLPYYAFDNFSGGHPMCKLLGKETDLFGIKMSDPEKEVFEKLEKLGAVPVKGIFPEETGHLLPDLIGFAYLDADNYITTAQALQLIGRRLEPTGMIILHDYGNVHTPGIERAVAEFLEREWNSDFIMLKYDKDASSYLQGKEVILGRG